MDALVTPHQHAKMIKLWADGAPIQYKINGGSWKTIDKPGWVKTAFYRVDPDFINDIESRIDTLNNEIDELCDLRAALLGN